LTSGVMAYPAPYRPRFRFVCFACYRKPAQNAVQHSGVRHVDARLCGTWNQIQLKVSDLGVGLNLETAIEVGGLGFNRMQERLKLVKGRLSIESRPKRGTTIWACVPLSLGSNSMR
jgi:signal transduction histidine kinase